MYSENVGFTGWDRPIGVSQWDDWKQRRPYMYDPDRDEWYDPDFDEYMEEEEDT